MPETNYWIITMRKGKRKKALLLTPTGGLWPSSERGAMDAAVRRAFAAGWEYADFVNVSVVGERHMAQGILDGGP